MSTHQAGFTRDNSPMDIDDNAPQCTRNNAPVYTMPSEGSNELMSVHIMYQWFCANEVCFKTLCTRANINVEMVSVPIYNLDTVMSVSGNEMYEQHLQAKQTEHTTQQSHYKYNQLKKILPIPVFSHTQHTANAMLM